MSSIDPTVKTSRAIDATLCLFDRLGEINLPVHPVYKKTPGLFLFLDPGWEEREYIVVQTNNDQAVSEWNQSSPAGAEERFVLDVVIRSMYPETDPNDPNTAVRAVLERLEVLADGVQSVTWDPATSKPKAIGFRNEIITGRHVAVETELGRTTEGIVGAVVVRFGLSAQI